MKIKDRCEATTADFWYDLTKGGYLKPEELLENPADVQRVKAAIAIVREFEASLDEQVKGVVQ